MLWFCTYCRTELRAAAPRIFGLPLQTADLQRVATCCNELRRRRGAANCQLAERKSTTGDDLIRNAQATELAGGSPPRLATKAHPHKGPIPAYAVRAGVPESASRRPRRTACGERVRAAAAGLAWAHMERASAYSPMIRRSCCCRHHLHTSRAHSARSPPRAWPSPAQPA